MLQFWINRWRTEDSLRYLPWGREAAEEIATVSPQKRARLQAADLDFAFGRVQSRIGRVQEAEAIYLRNLALRREEQDRRGEGAALYQLGKFYFFRRELARAESYVDEALAIHEDLGDRKQMGADWGCKRDGAALLRGQVATAKVAFERGLELAEREQDKRGFARIQTQLGQVAQWRGELDTASEYFQQAWEIAREIRDPYAERVASISLGNLALESASQWKEAERHTTAALELAWRIRDRHGEAICNLQLGEIALAWAGVLEDEAVTQQLEETERYLDVALQIAREIQDRRNEGAAIAQLGLLERERGRLGKAEQYFMDALAIAEHIGNRRSVAVNYTHLGSLAYQHGKVTEAERYFTDALAIAHEIEDRQEERYCLVLLGQLKY